MTRLCRLLLLLTVLACGLVALGGCEDDFGTRCTLPAKVQDACRGQGSSSSGMQSRVNCVMDENLDCSSRLCVVFQDSDPFCSVSCTTQADCPGDSRCEPFSITDDSDLYCVPPEKIREDAE